MSVFKKAARRALKTIDPDLERRIVNQYHFNRLRRRPPELVWQALPSCPRELYDAGGAQVGHELFVFGGLQWKNDVSREVFALNLRTCRWSHAGPLPFEMPQSHSGIVSDQKRFIYFVSGQFGNNCRPPKPDSFVFDAAERAWDRLPPLPASRYAPTAQLWRGRLHVLGGSKEDRNTPASEHWSIAVENGKALENQWRMEPPVPRGGLDRASAVLNDNLYVFGGQEGDYIAIPGDPDYRCTADLTFELMYPDTFRLTPAAREWKKMADMPIKASHIEFTPIKLGKKVILLGGQYEVDAKTKITYLTDAVQVFDADTGSWTVAGRLPYRTKSTISAYHDGWVYFTTGQRDKGPDDSATMNAYDRSLWRAKFSV